MLSASGRAYILLSRGIGKPTKLTDIPTTQALFFGPFQLGRTRACAFTCGCVYLFALPSCPGLRA